VHHEHREMHWRVLEIIEPDTAKASPAATDVYILLVAGPYAYLPGDEGEQYITAIRRDGQWWIEPNTTAYPRRGTPPATEASRPPLPARASPHNASTPNGHGRPEAR